jgi:hypothetical protein
MLNVSEDMPTNLSEDHLNGEFTPLQEPEVVYKVDDNFVSFEINRQVEVDGKLAISTDMFDMEPDITVSNSEGEQIILQLNQVIAAPYIGHYVCYFRCNDYWYCYDDNPEGRPKIDRIGDFHDMNAAAGNGCVLLIYSDSVNSI